MLGMICTVHPCRIDSGLLEAFLILRILDEGRAMAGKREHRSRHNTVAHRMKRERESQRKPFIDLQWSVTMRCVVVCYTMAGSGS